MEGAKEEAAEKKTGPKLKKEKITNGSLIALRR